MGALLALPKALGSALQTLSRRGIQYCLSYSISYIYLCIHDYFNGKRFDLYDFKSDEPEKTAFFVPHQEWKLDIPQADRDETADKSDDAFCFGVNSKSDALAIHVARQSSNQVRCSLFFRRSDGKTFTLPEEHVFQGSSTEDYTFGSSRLKLQCLVPMRKWRIFFNGVLREHSGNDESVPKYQHVTFTFIITASSGIFDFSTDMSKALLSQNASLSSTLKSLPISYFQRIRDIFNCYEQSVMILGTVKLKGEEEEEMYMWGSRGRYMGERNLNGTIEEIYANFQNGIIVHLGLLNTREISSRLAYGYMMTANGFIYPVDDLVEIPVHSPNSQLKFKFLCDSENYVIHVKSANTSELKFEKEHSGATYMNFFEISLDDVEGRGFVLKGPLSQRTFEHKSLHSITKHIPQKDVPLATSFEEATCQNSQLTGGKGSSLGKLSSMSKDVVELSQKSDMTTFEVPKGIVVTTEAYKLFIKGDLGKSLQKFQKTVWSKHNEYSKELCQSIVEEVSGADLPAKVSEIIETSLKKIFGDKVVNTKFAVRSSATGEDTEQMSAAGQMETFLGLKTMDEVLIAVKKCWASQFAFQAVEYKRRYGQLLNTPMAVVIQEMMACEVAGVAFTCDPVSGDPSFISLTANWGLGESVVSASSDPDTVTLERDICNNVKFHSQQIGTKQKKIIMNEHSGTKEVETTENSSNCCLTEEMAVLVGKISVKIEELFGSPRDLEWGIVNGKIFLFQARPITSLDIDTDFEIRHMFDTYMRREEEIFSKANVGEVMPGSTSPLSIDLLAKVFDICNKRQLVRFDNGSIPDLPYFQKRLVTAYNHIFFCLIDAFYRVQSENDEFMKSMMISLFGRPVENEALVKMSLERHHKAGKNLGFLRISIMLMMMFLSGIFVRKFLKKIQPYKVRVKPQNSAIQILNRIAYEYPICGEAMIKHMGCTMSSSFWNMIMLSSLSKARGEWNNDVFADFAYLLSSCTDVLSADVPAALEKLGVAIAKCTEVEKFQKMSNEEALDWLQNSECEAGQQFQEFLIKHGHRCLKEFDVRSSTWSDDPKLLIKMLKNLVGAKAKDTVEEPTSHSDILSKLRIPLNFSSRMKLKLLLPNCRRGVREREFSKSTLILTMDKLRKPFHLLSEVMVRDGYLPNKDIIFFLCIEELNQLIKTRSPRLVARALKRSKCHEEMDKFLFPEIINGIPKPINLSDAVENIDSSEGLTMNGVPVSHGVVKGTARVVVHLEDAVNIQPGDILITYSTDIGWSPYFPLLSGVVTELGGLISHGAVVAREYGLPCIVCLHGVTRVFKSGDLVILDGNKGILKRVNS